MAWHEQGIFLEGKADIFPFKILSVGGFDDELPIRIGRSVDGDSRMVELENLSQLVALIGVCNGANVQLQGQLVLLGHLQHLYVDHIHDGFQLAGRSVHLLIATHEVRLYLALVRTAVAIDDVAIVTLPLQEDSIPADLHALAGCFDFDVASVALVLVLLHAHLPSGRLLVVVLIAHAGGPDQDPVLIQEAILAVEGGASVAVQAVGRTLQAEFGTLIVISALLAEAGALVEGESVLADCAFVDGGTCLAAQHRAFLALACFWD